MTYREEFLSTHPTVHPGMKAFTEDGKELGKISELDEDSLVVKKGIFFPKDFTFRYDDVVDVHEDSLELSQRGSEIDRWKDENFAGWTEFEKMQAEPGEEQRIPLREEEVEIEKKLKDKGSVHLRKVVHTEMKTVEVPLKREEVIIERRPADETTREASDTGAMFEEKEFTIPISEEEVEVKKRPVIKEEAVIKKEKYEAKKIVDTTARKEELKVDRDPNMETEDEDEENEDLK
jgi:uncharacterized protein (TIGR02271 family)